MLQLANDVTTFKICSNEPAIRLAPPPSVPPDSTCFSAMKE